MEESHKNKQIIALNAYQNNYSCRYHQVVGNQTKQPAGSFPIQVRLVSFLHSPLYEIFCMSINKKLKNLCVLTQLWWPLKGGMAKCYFYFKYLILAALFSGTISLFLLKTGSILALTGSRWFGHISRQQRTDKSIEWFWSVNSWYRKLGGHVKMPDQLLALNSCQFFLLRVYIAFVDDYATRQNKNYTQFTYIH